MRKQRIYLLIGLPGSGKSTWTANKINNEINPRGIGVVSRDAIRYMINGDYKYDTQQQDLITDIAGATAKAILNRGKDIIIDQANINRITREEVIDFVYSIVDKDEIEIWFIHMMEDDTDELVNRRMSNARGESFSYHRQVIIKMKSQFEPITPEERYDSMIKVDKDGVASEVSWKERKAPHEITDDKIPLEELWNLHNILAEYIYPRLKAFRDMSCGAPGYFGEKEGEFKCKGRYGPIYKKNIGFDIWDKMLGKMVLAFELWLSQDDWDCEYNSKEHKKRWSKIEEGFSLFIKHFNGLWW